LSDGTWGSIANHQDASYPIKKALQQSHNQKQVIMAKFKILALIPFVMGWSSLVSYAQVEQWESIVETNISASFPWESDLVSDGHGHHFVVRISPSVVKYFFFDNSGNQIHSFTFTDAALRYPQITSYNGRLQVIGRTENNSIRLYRSSDVGVTWNFVESYGLLPGAISQMDAYEDGSGLHIAVRHFTLLSYVLRTQAPDAWSNESGTVSTTPSTPPRVHSIVVAPDSIHILERQGVFSRARTPGANWTSAQSFLNDGVGSMASYESFIHAVPYSDNANTSPNHALYFWHMSRKLANSTGWSEPLLLDTQVDNGPFSDWKPPLLVAGSPVLAASKLRTIYSQVLIGGFGGLYYRQYVDSWTPRQLLATSEQNYHIVAASLSANLAGIATFWCQVPDDMNLPVLPFSFIRRPIGIAGDITLNQWFTGNCYVQGNTTINSGVELRLKSNSVTFISDNTQLIIQSGASLIVEAGAQIKLGNNAAIIVNGTLSALGTETNRVIFSLSQGASQWSGITTGNSPPTITLNYANISNATTALSAGHFTTLTVDNCNFSNYNIGISIIPTAHSPIPTMQITNNTFTETPNNGLGISIEGHSDILLSGNTLTGPLYYGRIKGVGIALNASSPRMVGNSVEWFKTGFSCANISEPMLEDVEGVGNNTFSNNTYAVICDMSNANLGYDYGGNSICYNSAVDVWIDGGSKVFARNDSWVSNGCDPKNPPGTFWITSGSIDFEPCAGSCGGASPIAGGKNAQELEGGDPMMTCLKTLLGVAMLPSTLCVRSARTPKLHHTR
jgi:hypothetical protein